MNVYSIINENQINEQKIVRLYKALNKRMSYLEAHEPLNDGYCHDKWEESCDELDNLILSVSDINLKDEKETQDKWKDLIEDIILYQTFYGGLKRLSM